MRILIVIVVLLCTTVIVAFSLRTLLLSEQRTEPDVMPHRSSSNDQADETSDRQNEVIGISKNILERDLPDAIGTGDGPRMQTKGSDLPSAASSGAEAIDPVAEIALSREQLDVLRSSLRFVLRREQEEGSRAGHDLNTVQGNLRTARNEASDIASRLGDRDRKSAALASAVPAKSDELEAERHRSIEQCDLAASAIEAERAAWDGKEAWQGKIVMRTAAATAEITDLRAKLAQPHAFADEAQDRPLQAQLPEAQTGQDVKAAKFAEAQTKAKFNNDAASVEKKLVEDHQQSGETLSGAARLQQLTSDLERERRRRGAAERLIADLQAESTEQITRLKALTKAQQDSPTIPPRLGWSAEAADGGGENPFTILERARNVLAAQDSGIVGGTRSASVPILLQLGAGWQNEPQGNAVVGKQLQGDTRTAAGTPPLRAPASASHGASELPRAPTPQAVAKGELAENIAVRPSLPDAVPSHVLLRYGHEGTRSWARAQALLSALRMMGADVQDGAKVEAGKTGDAVTYFYAQDRGLADRVAQKLDGKLDGPAPVWSRAKNRRPLRPGTIEVSIGD